MTKIKLLSIAVIGMLVLNAVLLGFMLLKKPSMPNMPPGGGGKGNKNIIIKKLNLDEQQIAAYELLIRKHEDDRRDGDMEMKRLRTELYKNLNTDTGNADSIRTALAALHGKLESINYQHFLDIKKLCRPDQLAAYTELTKELSALFGRPKPGR